MLNYSLRYRTFNQLLEDVSVDFRNYALENMIEPQQLIKVARRVNYDLGLRISMTKQKVLEIEKRRVKLPDDFYILNFALVCGEWTVSRPAIQGRQIEEKACDLSSLDPLGTSSLPCSPTVDNCTTHVIPCDPCADPPTSCDPCTKTISCSLNKCGEEIQLVQILKTETRTVSAFFPLKIRSSQDVDCDCPNVGWTCTDEAWIKDGFLFTNFDCGNIYISYQGMMEDDEGNLVVPDHELLNDYYEYAFKERILENLWMGGEDVVQKMSYIAQKLKAARNQALGMVNMPNFEEMRKVFNINRKVQYARYYDMFRSYPPINSCWC